MRKITALVVLLFVLLLGNQSMAQQNQRKLVYIMDPVCAWCYGNIKPIKEIKDSVADKMPMEVYCGGMWTGDKVPKGGVEFYNLLRKHTPSIVIKTKERFSSAYYACLMDTTYRFSSFEPSKALWIVKNIAPEKFWEFKEKLQRGIFENAIRSDRFDSYIEIVDEMGLDHDTFVQMWDSKDVNDQVNTEFEISSSYSNSYPTLILVDGDKREVLGKGYFSAKSVLDKLK